MENFEPKLPEIGAFPERRLTGEEPRIIRIDRPDVLPVYPETETTAETEAAGSPEKLTDAALVAYFQGPTKHQQLLAGLKPDCDTRQIFRESVLAFAEGVVAGQPKLGYHAKLNIIALRAGVIAEEVLQERAHEIVHEVAEPEL
jgi:hypothetical protein